MKLSASYHIGCQSWGYDDWITQPGDDVVFYPRGTKRDEMLQQYARVFNTIEIDSTVYGLPPISNLESWYAKTPSEFTFSLKLPKEITHDRSLDTPSLPLLEEFLKRVTHLREKLGVLLIQLPAKFEADKDNGQNLRKFLAGLSREFRFAIEFRNSGWFIDWTFEELEKYRVALALVEGPWVPRETMFEASTRTMTSFAYIRMMGERNLEKFDRIYRDRTDVVMLWAERVKHLKASDIFIYLDNYFEGHAPATARKVQEILSLPTVDPQRFEDQMSLF